MQAIRVVLLFMFALGCTLGGTSAWALACYSSDAGGVFGGSGPGGSSRFYIDPSASVPESAPNDQIVWRGATQTVSITCYKDASNHPTLKNNDEQVYFWPGKTGDIGVPDIPGIKIGFRYQGMDIYGAKTPVSGFVVERCKTGESNSVCEARTQITKVITFQPIIVTAPGTFTGYSSALNIFQVDGEKGYNNRYANYFSVIENMDVLQPSKCEVEIELQNDDIDFGLLTENDVRNSVTQPLNIVVRNVKYGSDCQAVKLRGYFSNIRDTGNNQYVPVFGSDGQPMQGVAIRIEDQNGQPVELNEPIGAGFEIEQIGYERYRAVLYARDANAIDKGSFEGMVVYSVSYL